MQLIDLKKFIEEYTKQELTLLQFPIGIGTAAMIRPTTSVDATGGVDNFNVEIAVKSVHPATSCNIAGDVLLKLDKVTNKDVKEYQIILINALTSAPNYAGQTENNEYVYTIEFNVLTTKI